MNVYDYTVSGYLPVGRLPPMGRKQLFVVALGFGEATKNMALVAV